MRFPYDINWLNESKVSFVHARVSNGIRLFCAEIETEDNILILVHGNPGI